MYRGFSSLLCICLLRCMDPHPVIKCQEGEIEDAAWLPLEELKQQPLFVSQGTFEQLFVSAPEIYGEGMGLEGGRGDVLET